MNYSGIAEQLLRMDDDMFFQHVYGGIADQTPAAWLMVAVAYMNARPMSDAILDKARTNPKVYNYPPIIDSYVRIMAMGADQSQGDEFKSRKFGWLFQASLVMRANERCLGDSRQKDRLAELWVCLAKGCALLPGALALNELWDSNEKAWFSGISNSAEGVKYCLNHILPDELQKNHVIDAFSKQEGIRFVLGVYM